MTDEPLAEGSMIEETRLVKGKESTGRLRVVTLDPPSTFAITSEAEGISVTYRYRLHPEGAGTRIEWTCELEAAGLVTRGRQAQWRPVRLDPQGMSPASDWIADHQRLRIAQLDRLSGVLAAMSPAPSSGDSSSTPHSSDKESPR